MRMPLLALTASLIAPVAVHAGSTIELLNGDTVTGEVIASTDTTVTLKHETLGTVTIAKEQIVDGMTKAGPTTGSEQAAEEFANWIDSWFFSGWDKSVAAGFSGTDGNSETLNVYASVNTGYEDDTDRWDVDLKYFRATTQGETTQNQLKAIIIKDWLNPETPWFYGAQGSDPYDQVTEWESRFAGFVGAGYTYIDGPVHTVLLRAGVGGKYELGDINEFTPEAMLGVDWDWAISDSQNFSFYNYFYPSLDPAFSDFRNLTGAVYEVKLAAGDGLKLQLGVENEYNSKVSAGFEENDLKYFGALAFDF